MRDVARTVWCAMERKVEERNAVYQIWCRTCAANGIKSVYTGETANCPHQRGQQHMADYASTNPETMAKSVLRKHVDNCHDGV